MRRLEDGDLELLDVWFDNRHTFAICLTRWAIYWAGLWGKRVFRGHLGKYAKLRL